MASFQPRFTTRFVIPRYGARDEFIGTETIPGPSFETAAYMHYILAKHWGEYDDVSFQIVDHFPERDLANWGPNPLPFWAMDDDDLPF